MVCSALCTSDLHTHAGRRSTPTPTVLGHETVGTIDAFGPEAPTQDFLGQPLRLGDRVSWSVAASCGACYFCTNGLPQKCAELFKYGHRAIDRESLFVGGLADVVMLVPGTSVFRVPEGLPDEIAACANCATATAAAVLRTAAEVFAPGTTACEPLGALRGKTILILGGGPLGLTACAMAQAAGASEILLSDPDPAGRERARSFGAGHVYSADEVELARGVADRTGGRGADIVLELAGVASSVQASLLHGRIGAAVILAGTVLPTPSVPLDPERVVRRMLTIRGVHNYAPGDLGEALVFLAGPGRSYPFASLIGRTFGLDEVDLAFAHAHAHRGQRVMVRAQNLRGAPEV